MLLRNTKSLRYRLPECRENYIPAYQPVVPNQLRPSWRLTNRTPSLLLRVVLCWLVLFCTITTLLVAIIGWYNSVLHLRTYTSARYQNEEPISTNLVNKIKQGDNGEKATKKLKQELKTIFVWWGYHTEDLDTNYVPGILLNDWCNRSRIFNLAKHSRNARLLHRRAHLLF